MIDQLRQAAQQALDAIHLYFWAGDKHLLMPAHEALRTTLLQPPPPVQEPIAWLYPEGLEALQNGKCWTAYPTKHEDCNIPLYTASPQRPWVGLTEFQFAEIYNKWNDSNGSTPWALNQALEAKLKELKK